MAESYWSDNIASAIPAASSGDELPQIELEPFREALAKFKKRFTGTEIAQFEFSTIEELRRVIMTIQEEQDQRRAGRHLRRILSFVEAMEQFGKVIEIFMNAGQFLPFVWGPMKSILLVTTTYAESFDTILDAYSQISYQLPLLQQYERLFSQSPNMREILGLIYSDILEFHMSALRLIGHKTWKAVFRSTWKDFDTKFKHILKNLQDRRQLIHDQASIESMVALQEGLAKHRSDMRIIEEKFGRNEEDRRLRKLREVRLWLAAADSWADQATFQGHRDHNAQSCSWILENDDFRSWKAFQDSTEADPFPNPVLWIHGRPGAGKTILTSFIIDDLESRLINTEIRDHATSIPVSAYFYCRHMEEDKSTFVAMARTLITHLLPHCEKLIPYLRETSLQGYAKLTDPALAKRLLRLCLQEVNRAYIVVDGLDECSLSERRMILEFFDPFTQEEDDEAAERLRFLFVSQDSSDIRRFLQEVTTIAITAESNASDIRIFTRIKMANLQVRYRLSAEETRRIEDLICLRANGMFLYAQVVLDLLQHAGRSNRLSEELRLDNFPRGLEKAYERICLTIYNNPYPDAKEAQKLLQIILGAKRPLKFRELCGAASIDTRWGGVVEYDERDFFHNLDFCGSLIERSSDGRVTLVHKTARTYLLQHRLNGIAVEKEMSNMCMSYLLFNDFIFGGSGPPGVLVKSEFTAFQDYAVLHWIDHLEGLVTDLAEMNLSDISALVERFFQQYFETDSQNHLPDHELKKRYARFENNSCFKSLLHLVSRTRAMRRDHEGKEALGKIGEALFSLRAVMESASLANSETDGLKVFKCSHHRCFYFHEGFTQLDKRDRHVEQHNPPFCCTETGCYREEIGFPSEKELRRHIKMDHFDSSHTFPSMEAREERAQVFCDICNRGFDRAWNLKDHKMTHGNKKRFACDFCSRGFARSADCKRHVETHREAAEYVCNGKREGDGEGDKIWGCNVPFPNLETYARHFRLFAGRKCVKRFARYKKIKFEKKTPSEKEIAPMGTFPEFLLAEIPVLLRVTQDKIVAWDEEAGKA